MELRHLRYFLAVAETSNFRRAAEECYVAQSALSQQIARLESEVGIPLFFRTTRTVRLSPAGEALRPLATRILAAVEHATGEMAALAGLQQGRLRLGIIQMDASAVDIAALISAYNTDHPGIDLQVRTGASSNMAADVAAGELDVAITALPANALPPGLTHHPIVDDPLVAVMSPDAAKGLGAEIGLADLLGLGRFIHYIPGSGLRQSIERGCERAGLTLETTIELDQVSDMIRLAALGVGVTIVPTAAVQSSAGDSHDPTEFAALALADKGMMHPVGIVYDADRLSPAAAAFVATLNARR